MKSINAFSIYSCFRIFIAIHYFFTSHPYVRMLAINRQKCISICDTDVVLLSVRLIFRNHIPLFIIHIHAFEIHFPQSRSCNLNMAVGHDAYNTPRYKKKSPNTLPILLQLIFCQLIYLLHLFYYYSIGFELKNGNFII